MESIAKIDKGDTAWVLVCASFVFLMVRSPCWVNHSLLTIALTKKCPALGLFYAGLARAKNALSLMYLCLLSVGVVSIQVSGLFYY
jgi:Amt family ammonium transporter